METPQNRENEFLDLLHLLSLKGSPWSVVSLRQMIVRSSKLPSGGEITTLASLPFNKIINFLNCSNRMDFDLQDLIDQNQKGERRERRLKAIQVYQSYSLHNQLPKTTLVPTATSLPEPPSIPPKNHLKPLAKEEKALTDEEGLLLLRWASEGKKIEEMQSEMEEFSQFSKKQLQNLFTGTLTKICRTFLQVLPKHNCQLAVQEYQQTRFKNPQMLAYYKRMGIDVCYLFDRLMFLKSWMKQYSGYLTRGYLADYAPEDIVAILGELPDYFHSINSAFEESHASCPKAPKKRKGKGERAGGEVSQFGA